VKREIPEGAVVIYPHEVVTNLFGFAHDGSARKLMSRYGIEGQSGWSAAEVEEILDLERPGWRERGA